MKPSVLVKSAAVLALTTGFSATASASCGNGSLYCNSQGGSMIQPLSTYNSGASQYVPFSSTASHSGSIAIPGLGANERLTPTSCPVNVNGLESGQSVLGCYQVEKQQTTNVRYHLGAPTTVRYVRPIVYVRYPVPTPVYSVPYPVPTPVYAPIYGPRPVPVFRPAMCGGPVLPHPMHFGRCGW